MGGGFAENLAEPLSHDRNQAEHHGVGYRRAAEGSIPVSMRIHPGESQAIALGKER